ncbi:MAG: hypothetical protein JNK05_01830 [Myxococcales bacterium]|nr:hypothetical protein [Myxococcales bacterium]
MTDRDPVRLVDDPSTPDAVRDALSAVDAPPAYDAAAAARAVELAAVKAAGTAAAVAPWTKVALVLVVGATAVTATYTATRSARQRPSVTSVDQGRRVEPRPSIEPQGERSAPVVFATSDASALSSDASAVRIAAASRPTRVGPSGSAAEERDLLAEAQRALERESDARRAVALVAQHRRRFSRSALEEERSYLEFRARVRLGDAAEARRVGSAFVARFGGGIYGGPARRLLETLR